MPKGYFDVRISYPPHDRFVMVDSREVDYLTPINENNCVIHLRDGQRIETFLSRQSVQKMMADAQRQLDI